MRPSKRSVGILSIAAGLVTPAPAYAWGSEGHILIAAIARGRLTPATLAKVDALLALDSDALTPSDMLSRSAWADVWRSSHRQTSQWHFADIELDRPDLDAACFGHPPSAIPASAGPANECLIDKVADFARELGAPDTPRAERILALKFVLHFVGDMHQPLHVADNHDRGGNCVSLLLGPTRTVNLHSYWDAVVVSELGKDARAILTRLTAGITPTLASEWSRGDFASWAKETNDVAVKVAYSLKSPAGCDNSSGPIELPKGYDDAAQTAAAKQLERAGVRLADVLERELGALSLTQITAT